MTSFRDRGLALIGNGYQLIPIPARSKAPAIKDWEGLRADERMVNKWASNGYAEGSNGLLTKKTPGADLDILDAAFVVEMQEVSRRIVASPLPIPMRVGRSPKCLLLFYAAHPFPKVASPFFMSPDGKKHRVEILGDGQQFVAFGIHPDTGKEYRWITDANPLNTPIDELPSITHDQAKEIVREFTIRAEARGWKRVAMAFQGSFDEIEGGSNDPSGIDMRPKLRVTAEDVREALKLLDGYDDYETWVRVGMGLHHQFAGSEEGLDIWLEWSQQWSEYKAKKGEKSARYRWAESFLEVRDSGHGPITVAFIIKHANAKRREQEEAAFNELQGKVDSALDFKTLTGQVAKDIAASELSPMQRSVLTRLMQKAAKKFTGVNVSIKDIAAMTRPRPEESGKGRSFEELEITLARRVLRTRFEDGAHIKRFSKLWHTYQAGVWRREEDEFIERCVLETLTDLRRINDKTLRELLDQMDESRGDRLNALVGTVTAVMSKLVAEQGNNDPLGLNSFDAPRVVNCTNVEVWIDDDGEIKEEPHNPVHNLTAQIACEYAPKATCPTWDQSMRVVFQDFRDPENMIRHFYELFGYIMQPSRETAIWLLLKGGGDNGKSFIVGIIAEIMGRSVISKSIAEIAKNTNTHFTTALVGKLMLLDDDLETHTVLPDGWLKKLSEAKLLSADPKYGSVFDFIARAIPVILTNPWPATTDLSEGLRRRVHPFEFTHMLTEAEKDPNHLRTIRTFELPGVLNHLIGGMQRFLARGGKFDPPPELIHTRARWLASSNTTMRFVEECVERRGAFDPRGSVRASDLYDRYMQWLRHWEISAKPLGRNKFYEAMDALRMKRANHAGVTYYSGIRLKDIDMGFDDLDGDDGLGE